MATFKKNPHLLLGTLLIALLTVSLTACTSQPSAAQSGSSQTSFSADEATTYRNQTMGTSISDQQDLQAREAFQSNWNAINSTASTNHTDAELARAGSWISDHPNPVVASAFIQRLDADMTRAGTFIQDHPNAVIAVTGTQTAADSDLIRAATWIQDHKQ